MKNLINCTTVLLSTTLLFSACKKHNSTPPPDNNALIVGKWTSSFYARDTNNNNTLDASEKTTVVAGNERITFLNNNTGVDSSVIGGNLSFTWTINGDYVTLNLAGTTFTNKLIQLDANIMIVQDTSAHPTTWFGYVKQ